MALTIRDVAREANVAVDTARKALRRDPTVRSYLQERVDEVVRRLNYRPNRLAQALSNQTSHVVPVILSRLDSPFFTGLALRLSDHLARAGYVMVISTDVSHLIELNAELRTPGCISVYGASNTELRNIAQDHAVVTITRAAGRIVNAANVRLDFAPAYRRAGELLIAEGRKRFAVCSAPLAAQRLAAGSPKYGGAVTVLAEHGLSPVKARRGQDVFASPAELESYLEQHPHAVDAVFCENDAVTANLLARLGGVGRQVPQDIRVVGCDGLQELPRIWTVHSDLEQIAEMLVAQLVSLLDGKPTPERRYVPVLLDENRVPL